LVNEAFKYHHVAKFAYVGDWKAVGEFKKNSQTKGFWTFLVWRSGTGSKISGKEVLA